MLHYPFPHIDSLDDVLPYIADNPTFIHVDKGLYSVINYTHMAPETFPDWQVSASGYVRRDYGGVWHEIPPMAAKLIDAFEERTLRECRGLIFDDKGKIISRPFHKFFNAGERDSLKPSKIDLFKPHHIMDKLDGSMVRPFLVNGNIRWGTKMGITTISMMAEEFVAANSKYQRFAKAMLNDGFTPIFEFMSEGNRVVLDYGKVSMKLIAIRHIESGKYTEVDLAERTAAVFEIPTVSSFQGGYINPEDLINQVRGQKDCEGIIIRFDDGHMVKIKTEWYLARHGIVDKMWDERKVVQMIVDEVDDDVLPLLSDDDKDRLLAFKRSLVQHGVKFSNKVAEIADGVTDRKTFALGEGKKLSNMLRGAVFAHMDGKSGRNPFSYMLSKNLNTREKWYQFKKECGINVKWSRNGGGNE